MENREQRQRGEELNFGGLPAFGSLVESLHDFYITLLKNALPFFRLEW